MRMVNAFGLDENGGNNRARTCDPLLVRQMLSQLSYAPTPFPFVLSSATAILTIHYDCGIVNTFFEVFSKKLIFYFVRTFNTNI